MGSYKNEKKHGLKDTLSLLMEECDIDDAQLARETGVPVSTIARMRINSDSNPTASTLMPISKYFSVSINQLLGDEPLPKDRLPGTHNPASYTSARMPIIEWEWINNWVENGGDHIREKLKNWLSTEKEVGHNAFALTISTDSFGVAFRKGSTIIVDPSQSPNDGDLVLVQCINDNNALLKQFILDGNDGYLRSVNPEIKSIIPISSAHNIIGVIIETRFSMQTSEKKSSLEKEKKPQSSFSEYAYLKPT